MCVVVRVTCLLRVLFVQFSPLVSVADAEVSEEINEEGTVEILAQLIEDKPENKELYYFIFNTILGRNCTKR